MSGDGRKCRDRDGVVAAEDQRQFIGVKYRFEAGDDVEARLDHFGEMLRVFGCGLVVRAGDDSVAVVADRDPEHADVLGEAAAANL